jgi:hypothetical protein
MSTGCPRLDQDLAVLHALREFQPADAAHLEAGLLQATQTLADADLDRYDADAIRTAGVEALDDMFDLRVGLKSRLPEWQAAGLLTDRNIAALRGVFRDGRYAADMIGELIHDVGIKKLSGKPAKPAVPGFWGGKLNTLVNPEYGEDGKISLRSGDVLLVRGMAANSAAIARIGDVDSQFSHVGLIHIDKDSGPVSVVEALIAKGATVTPLNAALESGIARAVVLRPRDRQLAADAASLAKALVDRSLSGPLPHIPYDFTMRLGRYEQLFCSKLIRYAYASATDGAVQLPAFPTRLGMRNRSFFDQIGVATDITFAPADVELDPFFDIVAEWRDFRNTALIRNQDIVMDMIFYWMEEEGLVFRETAGMRIVSGLGKLSGYLPWVLKSLLSPLVPPVPSHMPRSGIAAVAMLHTTCQELVRVLTREERRIRERTGRPMHPREAYAALASHKANTKARIGYLARAA